MNPLSRLLPSNPGAPRRLYGVRVATPLVRAAALFALAAALALGGCANIPALKGFGKTSKPDTSEEQAAETKPAEPAIAEPGPVPEPQEEPKPGKLYEWDAKGRTVTHVVIDLDEQKARFYAGNEQVGWSMIASGLPSHATPRGEFAILEKSADKRSNLYGRIVNAKGGVIKGGATSRDRVPAGGRFQGAAMPHFMRMTFDGVGMHAGPIPHPGRPASHGCIRMPPEIAANLFKVAPSGTRVTVQGSSGPDYGNYVARAREEQIAAAKRPAEEGGTMETRAARRAVAKVAPKRAAAPAAARTSVAQAKPPPTATAQPAGAPASAVATTAAAGAVSSTPATGATATPATTSAPAPGALAAGTTPAAAGTSPATATPPAPASVAPPVADAKPATAPAAPTPAPTAAVAATPSPVTTSPTPAAPSAAPQVTPSASPSLAPTPAVAETAPNRSTPAPAPAAAPAPPASTPPTPKPAAPAPTPAAPAVEPARATPPAAPAPASADGGQPTPTPG